MLLKSRGRVGKGLKYSGADTVQSPLTRNTASTSEAGVFCNCSGFHSPNIPFESIHLWQTSFIWMSVPPHMWAHWSLWSVCHFQGCSPQKACFVWCQYSCTSMLLSNGHSITFCIIILYTSLFSIAYNGLIFIQSAKIHFSNREVYPFILYLINYKLAVSFVFILWLSHFFLICLVILCLFLLSSLSWWECNLLFNQFSR